MGSFVGEGPSEKMRFTIGNQGKIVNYSLSSFLMWGAQVATWELFRPLLPPPSLHPQASAWAVVSGGEV